MILVWYTYTSAKQEVEDAMLSISEAKTNHAVSSMSLLFKSMTTSLYNMVVDPHVLQLMGSQTYPEELRQKTTEWVEIIVRSNEYYRDIYILDKSGSCIVSSNPGQVGKSFADLGYVKQALRGQFNLGECSVGRVTKNFSVIMAGPIDVKDHVAGVLVIINDFPNIVDYGQKTSHDSQTVFTAFLTPEGFFAAHKDNTLMGNRRVLYPELYDELADAREHGGPVAYTLRDHAYVGYAKVEPNTKWIIVTSGKQQEVLASAYRMGLVVTVISGFFLGAISLVVIQIAAGVINSMVSLITYAKAVSEGELDRKLEATHRRDELGVLHKALQRLVTTLKAILVETQKASEMKGQFLANMSHEIRTPLNAIIGMTHLMLKEEHLSNRMLLFIEKIQISSRLLFGLINDILDLSKVEAGMIELEHIPFDLHKVITNALTIHQENAETKGIQLIMEYTATQQRFIGDPLRIGQILNNLLSNALKFTREGSVTIRCWNEGEFSDPATTIRMPTESEDTPDDTSIPRLLTVFISVTDTGVGIAPEALERLFQPFTQADASISRQFGGTGLGLTISRSLVHLLGGTLEIASEQGVGTTLSFSMLLELQPQAETTPENAPSESCEEQLNLTGKTILVAEDNAINQLIMQEMLKEVGAEVVIANNGQEAVDLVSKQRFDLIFMDMQMPIMDGLQATRKIRLLAMSDNLPIIALTANAMKEDKAKCFESGMNAYITKPIDPVMLMDMLKKWA